MELSKKAIESMELFYAATISVQLRLNNDTLRILEQVANGELSELFEALGEGRNRDARYEACDAIYAANLIAMTGEEELAEKYIHIVEDACFCLGITSLDELMPEMLEVVEKNYKKILDVNQANDRMLELEQAGIFVAFDTIPTEGTDKFVIYATTDQKVNGVFLPKGKILK